MERLFVIVILLAMTCLPGSGAQRHHPKFPGLMKKEMCSNGHEEERFEVMQEALCGPPRDVFVELAPKGAHLQSESRRPEPRGSRPACENTNGTDAWVFPQMSPGAAWVKRCMGLCIESGTKCTATKTRIREIPLGGRARARPPSSVTQAPRPRLFSYNYDIISSIGIEPRVSRRERRRLRPRSTRPLTNADSTNRLNVKVAIQDNLLERCDRALISRNRRCECNPQRFETNKESCAWYTVEEHVECGCSCPLAAEGCATPRVLNERKCACECPNTRERRTCLAKEKNLSAELVRKGWTPPPPKYRRLLKVTILERQRRSHRMRTRSDEFNRDRSAGLAAQGRLRTTD
ncbi:hypothetical protein EVAR_46515_1 [Eumeta japonica]|uniref:Platelet-derived growth factor (PDGF) family profile domain-containing protein n=1 Tax=Eumeta variegata TaxID=151549 RepID=A0A4C1WV83_EUMVA|nr:hypothetical protein EVAR_46515_1 [Eumeta japonica]